ncbi:hypothetical protein C8R45DRAFT_1212261, partial [Mycena sanguinolenta]
MKLLAFVSIAFFTVQLGVTANPIPDPLPVPEVATPVCMELPNGVTICTE